MDQQQPKNCDNCGASHFTETGGELICEYCGSVVDTKALPKDNFEAVQLPAPSPAVVNREDASGRSAAGAIIAIIIIVIVVGMIAGVNKGSSDHQSAYADSLLADTTKRDPLSDILPADKTPEKGETPPYIKAALEQLSTINVDPKTFRKLYSNARKVRDQFTGYTHLYDKSSPRYVNYNGIYAYVSMDTTDVELRFSIQYTADEWLFIKSMTFNADGENFGYAPDMKTDNGDGAIWEWSDDSISDSELPMLVSLATAKKAKVKYDGDKYYKVVAISRSQQQALLKELKIYKGLLLKYPRK